MDKCTEQEFMKSVAKHRMTVLANDGVYRHIRFQKPGTNVCSFEIITWPGHLCYTGDMGTFVFKRLEDMLEFFRDEKADVREKLYIDPDYWSEKCIAVCGTYGIEEYDAGRFVEAVNDYLNDNDASDALRKAVNDEILVMKDEGEDAAMRAVGDFTYKDENGEFEFTDFHEYKITNYTYRFVWCCYALAWAIKMYDQEEKQ